MRARPSQDVCAHCAAADDDRVSCPVREKRGRGLFNELFRRRQRQREERERLLCVRAQDRDLREDLDERWELRGDTTILESKRRSERCDGEDLRVRTGMGSYIVRGVHPSTCATSPRMTAARCGEQTKCSICARSSGVPRMSLGVIRTRGVV